MAGVLLEAGTDSRFYSGVRVAHLLSFVRCRIMCLYFLSSVL